MDQTDLEKCPMEQLAAKARRCGVPLTSDRRVMIEGIMTAYERQSQDSRYLFSRPESPSEHARAERTPSQVAEEDRPVTERTLMRVVKQMQQQTHLQQLQFERLLEVLGFRGTRDPAPESEEPSAASREDATPRPASRAEVAAATGTTETRGNSGNIISWIAMQIPEFAGSEEESVNAWINRVDKIAQVHEASDRATLLAASSKLVKEARQWYELQTGEAIESWAALRRELVTAFEKQVMFHKVIQKIEARRWQRGKESFDKYALEKLVMIKKLNLPDKDAIHLLIGGILAESLRATALSIDTTNIDEFVRRMRGIAEGVSDGEKKFPVVTSVARNKENGCRNCGKKGHHHKDCRGDLICFICKKKGHRTFECPSKEQQRNFGATARATREAAAASVYAQPGPSDAVAAVDDSSVLELSDPYVQVCALGGRPCNLTSLIDTGSPVSFIKYKASRIYWKRIILC